MSWKVLVTARTIDEAGDSALANLRAAGMDVVFPDRPGPLSSQELLRWLAGKDAVLASMDPFNAVVLDSPAGSALKIISRWGVGYDAIDVPQATQQGIVVAYTPEFLNETVADYTFALLLAAARRVHEVHARMLDGQWSPAWGHDIHGKTLGIVGCGRIGRAVARRAKGFDLRVLAYDIAPNRAAEDLGVRFVSLDDLLRESDFLCLHASLTPQSRGIIGAAQFRRMKPTAYLINTARGALVDEAALAQALEAGWLAGAALDVFSVEPLPLDHPLRRAPRLLLSPHQSSYARETGENVSLAAAQAIIDLMHGRRPQWVVDPAVFDSPALRARLA